MRYAILSMSCRGNKRYEDKTFTDTYETSVPL